MPAMTQRHAHARAYPFAIPQEDFLYADGTALPLRAAGSNPMQDSQVRFGDGWRPVGEVLDHLGVADRSPRLPLIGYGSNRSPERLKQKYGACPGPTVMAVTRAWLEDFDTAYVAHFAHYGSVPAGLQYRPGTRVQVSVLWLDAAQLERMHQTESVGDHYGFGRLSPLRLTLLDGVRLDAAWTYVPLHGLVPAPAGLHHVGAGVGTGDGCAVALRAVTAERRTLPALSQGEMLDVVAARLAPGRDTDQFIARLLDDGPWRHSMTERLREGAIAFAGGHLFERHMVTGET
ncbi:MAG: hypothetical protein RLP96_10290 [Alphaproteobacteria bacterium]